MLRRFSIVIALLFSLCATGVVFAYTSPGSPQGYVSDFAGMLSSSTREDLTATLSVFRQETTNEIAVVTIPSLQGDDIEGYANTLFREWGIGGKEKNNGILLLISRDDRKIRIEVGYGLEGALTDAQSNSIIQKDIIPAFRDGKYNEGVITAVGHIIDATKGEYTATGGTSNSSVSGFFNSAENIFFFIVFPFLWVVSILSRSKSWWAGGVVGGVVAIVLGFVWSSLITGLILGIIFIPIGLLIDFVVSRAYVHSRKMGTPLPWWIGGNGGGSGHSGFGGFGGGSSGGGGASGSW